MFLNVSVKDMIDVKTQKVSFNEVIIYKSDIKTIPKLMQYFTFQKIFIQDEIRLDSLIPTKQNEIGLIFFEFYGYLNIIEGIQYLNKSKFDEMFYESAELKSILIKVDYKYPVDAKNSLSIKDITTNDLNLLILNWFDHKNRNFRSIEKFIPLTDNLFDININHGYFEKIVDPIEFLSLSFDRFIRIAPGEIPFSNNFGSNIKQSIMTKSSYFTKKAVRAEIEQFTRLLTSVYSNVYTLEDISYKEEGDVSQKLTVMVTISINKNEAVTFKIA